MRKFRLLPGIFAFILCAATLIVGVYAAGATTNTITGNITVTAANCPVTVVIKRDGSTLTTLSNIITAHTYTDSTGVTFDLATADAAGDIATHNYTLSVTNNSTSKSIKAHFADSVGGAAVTSRNGVVKQSSTNIINAAFTGQQTIAASGSYDMVCTLSCATLTETNIAKTSFNMYLVITPV